MLHFSISFATLRWIGTVVSGLLALLFWYKTLTVPMEPAMTSGLIALFLTIVCVWLWPTHPNRKPITQPKEE